MLAELDRPFDAGQQLLKNALAVDQGDLAQIKSAEIENVKDVVDQSLRAALDR